MQNSTIDIEEIETITYEELLKKVTYHTKYLCGTEYKGYNLSFTNEDKFMIPNPNGKCGFMIKGDILSYNKNKNKFKIIRNYGNV